MVMGPGCRIFLPHPSPSGFQPARYSRGVFASGEGGYGTYFRWKDEFGSRTVDKGGHFRTNHSCRLAPALQGLKTGSVVGQYSLRCSGLGWTDGPSGAGDKPLALRSLRPRCISPSPPLWIPARPRRVRGRLFGGITMALRRPHKRMRIVELRALSTVRWSHPSSPIPVWIPARHRRIRDIPSRE